MRGDYEGNCGEKWRLRKSRETEVIPAQYRFTIRDTEKLVLREGGIDSYYQMVDGLIKKVDSRFARVYRPRRLSVVLSDN